MSILKLPNEVLEQIFTHLDPIDASCVSRCCQLLRQVLYSNQFVWRELYVRLPLDDPMSCVSFQGERRHEFDWNGAVQRFTRARTVLYDPEQSRPGEHLTTLQTLLDLITWVPPLIDMLDSDNISHNLVWVRATLLHTPLFEDIEQNNSASDEERRLCARIHTYFGLTKEDNTRGGRKRSRAFVYDMRKYTPDTFYGPLTTDGSVDWLHVRAIHHVVSMHIVDFQNEAPENKLPIFPMTLQSTQIVLPPDLDLDDEDWVGVTGSWKVSFCFCDHRDLLSYNETVPDAAGNLNSSIFDDRSYGEVYRTLNLNLKLVCTTPDCRYPKRPIIHFVGEMPDTTSTMNGRIQMLEDGQVQWKFISGEQGHAVWHSVGVQIGGLRSRFGVLGSWTTVFHDSEDPVGPFWLRRENAAPGLPMDHVSINTTTP